jgi:hypothetical protein
MNSSEGGARKPAPCGRGFRIEEGRAFTRVPLDAERHALEGESCMKDETRPDPIGAPEELSDERSEFSHRLASFGLGEKPGRLLEDSPRRASRPVTKPVVE